MALPLMFPTEIQLKLIYDNFGVDKMRHQYLLNAFKNWLKTEKHLPQTLEENYLSLFLLMCKDDLSKAKLKFEANIINRNSKLLSKINFKPGIVDLNVIRQCVVSPYLTENGYRITYYSLPETTKEFNFHHLLSYALNLTDVILFEDNCIGGIVIMDFKNVSVEIIPNIDISLMAEFLKLFLNSFPNRILNFHIIHCNELVKPVITLLKSCLSEKLRKRFLIHNRVEDLLNYFPKTHLPIEYGGNDFNLDDLTNDWKKYFEKNNLESKLSKLQLQGEIPKEKICLGLDFGFGNDGTFRNLQVD